MKTMHGFELIREETIHETNSKARLFRHLRSGAQLISIENDDENKVFGITFRTPPVDSTGVPHIMEHSVLCGSRKYPVKEPFVELMKGSLNTFLNAMTFADKTCYPVASQNKQDFYNLVDVYLDAVLYPNLTRHTFEQEGWHFELDALEEPMAFKGVVFNEMKGAYSTPDEILGRHSQAILFPDNTYHLDSGGDPRGQPVTTLSVATNRRYNGQNGQPVKETTWFRVTVWGKQAESCNEFLHKGSKVLVEGRLTPDPDTGGPHIWENNGKVGAR